MPASVKHTITIHILSSTDHWGILVGCTHVAHGALCSPSQFSLLVLLPRVHPSSYTSPVATPARSHKRGNTGAVTTLALATHTHIDIVVGHVAALRAAVLRALRVLHRASRRRQQQRRSEVEDGRDLERKGAQTNMIDMHVRVLAMNLT